MANEQEQKALEGSISTLRQWKQDADGVVAIWDDMSNTQRFIALKTVIQRFGLLCNASADFLKVMKYGD